MILSMIIGVVLFLLCIVFIGIVIARLSRKNGNVLYLLNFEILTKEHYIYFTNFSGNLCEAPYLVISQLVMFRPQYHLTVVLNIFI